MSRGWGKGAGANKSRLGSATGWDCNCVTPRYYNHREWEPLNVKTEMKVSLFVPRLSSTSKVLASQQSVTIWEASSWHLLIADCSRGIFSATADRFAIFPWLILSPRGMKSLRFSEQWAWTPIKLTVRATPSGSPTKQIWAAILMLASVTGQTESNFSPKIYALFMQSLINPFSRLFSQINSTRKLDHGSDL